MLPPDELQARNRARRFELVVFLLALALRLVALWQYQHAHPNADHPVIDEASYDRWARAIAGGDWLGHEVFFQEPLYPYALGALYALFGPERVIARVAQCVLWSLAAVLAGRIARRAFGEWPARIAALGIALYGPGLVFPALLLKENLFLALFALFALRLLGATRARDWLVLGLLGALGALLRGNMLVLLPVFALWPLARERSRAALVRTASFAAGVLLVLAPVGLRNQAVGGVFVLTTSGAGTNLYGGNNVENPWGRATEFSFVRGIPEHEADDWRHEAERRSARTLDRGEVSRFWMHEVWSSVQRDPALHARILWNKLRLSLGRYEVPDNHCLDWDARYVPIAQLPWPDFGLVGALGLIGFLLSWRHSRAARELALLFALYLGTIVLTVTSDRARLPLVVPLAPLAGFALHELVRRARDGSARERIAGAAALAGSALLVWIPALPAGERAQDLDEREFNLAIQRLDEPQGLAEARAIAAGLRQRQPRSARVLLLQAEIDLALSRQGGGGRALDEVEREIAPLATDEHLKPRERFHAQWIAGSLALARRDATRARELFEAALRFDPEEPRLRLSAATAQCLASELGPVETAVLESALRTLVDLEGSAGDAAARAEARIARCGAQFLLGRERLRGAPQDPAARALVQAAIEGLRDPCLDKSLAPPLRARARQLAGTIQLALGEPDNAENHFRAVLALAPDAREGKLGLAEALIAQLEKGVAKDKVEIERLLDGLDVPALRARLAALR